MEEMKDELCDAVFKDLGRDAFATELLELGTIKNSAQWDMANLEKMTKTKLLILSSFWALELRSFTTNH